MSWLKLNQAQIRNLFSQMLMLGCDFLREKREKVIPGGQHGKRVKQNSGIGKT